MRGEQAPELHVTPDERPSQAAHAPRAHERERAHEATATDALGLSLHLDRGLVVELEGAAGGRDRALADEDLARLRALLQPRRHVDRVSGDEGAPFTRAPDHDLAGVDADPQLEPGVELTYAAPHCESGVQGPLGVVLESRRGAERRHHRVAGELLGRSAGTLDLFRRRVVEAAEQGTRALRVL